MTAMKEEEEEEDPDPCWPPKTAFPRFLKGLRGNLKRRLLAEGSGEPW